MGKPVFQFKLDGNYITKHESISEAARVMGCNESSIRKVIDKYKNSCGFIWKSQGPMFNKAGLNEEFTKSAREAGQRIKEEYVNTPEIVENLIKYGTEYDPKDVAFKPPVTRVLVIGDLHAPFIREGYLDFCKNIYKKYNCNEVVFIGDLIDQHFSSFWNIDPDGHSAAEELRLAKLQIQEWYKTFPIAKVCIGNHDLIPARKMFNAGVSKVWLKDISEILNTPNWEYAEEFIIDEVLYVHGISRKALERMKADLISVVQGHYHSESYIHYAVGKFKKMFAMQVGCGVDDKSYAMAYNKHFNKVHVNCGVVLENGQLPILEYMNL